MKSFKAAVKTKEGISLIIGISIPVLMILFVAASIYLPRLFVRPKFSFVYTVGSNFGKYYFVRDQHLDEKDIKYPDYYTSRAENKIFLYDIEQDESREIPYTYAAKLRLNSKERSPDGFRITYGTRTGGFFPFFFFSDRDYWTLYIQGHGLSRKLNIRLEENYFQKFRFLGWVLKNK